MSDNEAAVLAIASRAKDNGWLLGGFVKIVDVRSVMITGKSIHLSLVFEVDGHKIYHRETTTIEALIFEPNFARALWGEETWSVDPTGWHRRLDADPSEEQAWFLSAWEYYLQQVAIQEDKYKYLIDYLAGEQ